MVNRSDTGGLAGRRILGRYGSNHKAGVTSQAPSVQRLAVRIHEQHATDIVSTPLQFGAPSRFRFQRKVGGAVLTVTLPAERHHGTKYIVVAFH